MLLWVKQVSHTEANKKTKYALIRLPHTKTHARTETHTLYNPLWHLLSPLPSGSAVMASQPSAIMAVGESSRMWSVLLLLPREDLTPRLVEAVRTGRSSSYTAAHKAPVRYLQLGITMSMPAVCVKNEEGMKSLHLFFSLY